MYSITGNTILVTGGGTGIGLAIAKRFVRDKNTVIITGRRLDKLNESKDQIGSDVHVVQGDVSSEASREALFQQVVAQFPNVNVLINNAGIQRSVNLKEGTVPSWSEIESEIRTNLSAPIHLSLLFVKYWLDNKISNPCVTNVTSGLSFVPAAHVPVYSSTKAGLHSFTWSLRHQLKSTPIKVVEIIPPAVDTDLQTPGVHKFGVNVDVFADDIYAKLKNGEEEVAHGMSENHRVVYRNTIGPVFDKLNQ